MSKLLAPILALLVLIPATVYGQKLSPFVEAGALAEGPDQIAGWGGHAELGIFVSPTVWIGVRTDAIKRRYADARWSAYSLIAGVTAPTAYHRVAIKRRVDSVPFARKTGVP
jgi:hypothetical protein